MLSEMYQWQFESVIEIDAALLILPEGLDESTEVSVINRLCAWHLSLSLSLYAEDYLLSVLI